MAELATIARPYAEALFRSQQAQANLDATGEWLSALASIANDAQLQAFVASPKVTSTQIFNLFTELLKQVNLPEIGKNFLHTLIDNKRLNVLPEIATQFQTLKNQSQGSSQAVLYSAYPLDNATTVNLLMGLQKKFNQKLHVQIQVDPELIGGLRLVVGDKVFDTSVKAQLEQMKSALTQ